MMTSTIRQLVFGMATALGLTAATGPAVAETSPEHVLATTVETLETRLDARIGVMIIDSASDWTWTHRAHERFLMASVFKSVLCGAVLHGADAGTLSLNEPLAIDEADILSYAPVAKEHVGGTLSIGELCFATLDMSDNTAANLLIDRVGGPQAVTDFLRSAGDDVTRLDRMEPELNLFVPGDPRDTTSPAAMAATWRALLLDNVLTPASRGQLTEWMRHGGVTGTLIRASAPQDWVVMDKSGGGRDFTRNLVAMIVPPGRPPFIVAIFLSDTPADWSTRNDAVAEISAAVVDVLKAR